MDYSLRLPPGTDQLFIALLERIPADRRDAWRVVRVNEGETLAALAERHGLTVEQIAQVNGLMISAPLESGMALVLPLEVARTPLRGRVEEGGVQIARRSTRRTTITVRPGDTLSRIAARYGVSARDLARLNKMSVKSQLRAGQKLVVALPDGSTSRSASDSRPTSYRVRRGDTLSDIARRYGVTVSDLRNWNGLRSNQIRVGQRLVLTPQSAPKIKRTTSKKVIYHVRRGDTLTSIARRYGVSVDDLKAWNKLRSSKLLVGQPLTISR